MTEPTERELAALRAYAMTGDYARAAERIGASRSALRGILARMRRKAGVETTVELVYLYRDRLVA